MVKLSVALLLCAAPALSNAQLMAPKTTFTHADTLRGTITPERAWWDLLHYDLRVEPDLAAHTIQGSNTITYKVLKPYQVMQIDLQAPLTIDSVLQDGRNLQWTRDGNAWLIHLVEPQRTGGKNSLTIWYHGVPRAAVHAPWDGGIDWKTDSLGNPWVSSACQGMGASTWWPTKDHQYDEPDNGCDMYVTVPDSLMDVSNGRLIGEDPAGPGKHTYHWQVKNPINNYDMSINIGKYAHWSDTLMGEKGVLDLNFYVLAYNLDRAKEHFAANVKPMIHCFEYWMGPYPFYEDGYKLVESYNLGMEHQSATQYGNRFVNGYRTTHRDGTYEGIDLSHTGWGLKWDFIIIHESGHEWFGNNITSKDLADMWVHEGFTNYSETLFVDCQYGKAAGDAYCQGTRKNIRNDQPIIGPYNVNKEGSGDMYYKGGNLINTIRCIIGDDEAFRQILRGLNKTFYHQTVTTAQIEHYISEKSGIDFSKTFDQYLRTTKVPVLTYTIKDQGGKSVLNCRWSNCIEGFDMPVRIDLPNGQTQVVKVTAVGVSTTLPFAAGDLPKTLVDSNIYVTVKAE
ncbi:M1 family metallopeptidase [Dinghuibacter silviterrae]|uniref:Peptidase M1-like protein n=1 Tax=Dinghuibacter silviterrae TaxID=1539049 RepID=A0A4R8DSW9_9BACT|nr:M1 family metallopeptidase [Dinghuibacter silviterrae]TDX01179.1 peptidase M1-like protein [Dinghuibacter silviterrae]